MVTSAELFNFGKLFFSQFFFSAKAPLSLTFLLFSFTNSINPNTNEVKLFSGEYNIFNACLPGGRNDSSFNIESVRYEAVPGKIVGIWPRGRRRASLEELKALRDKWGFNYIFLQESEPDTISSVLKAGYTFANLMMNLTPSKDNSYKKRIETFRGVFAFYVDEPAERNLDTDSLKEYIKTNSPSSKYIISGYRRTSRLEKLAMDADIIMFSGYNHWRKIFPGIWISWPVNTDQRDDWSDMKERFGDKFSMTWIGAHTDRKSYGELLEHARKLGLTGVWLYQLEEGEDSDENIAEFCFYASQNGFLRKVEKPK